MPACWERGYSGGSAPAHDSGVAACFRTHFHSKAFPTVDFHPPIPSGHRPIVKNSPIFPSCSPSASSSQPLCALEGLHPCLGVCRGHGKRWSVRFSLHSDCHRYQLPHSLIVSNVSHLSQPVPRMQEYPPCFSFPTLSCRSCPRFLSFSLLSFILQSCVWIHIFLSSCHGLRLVSAGVL